MVNYLPKETVIRVNKGLVSLYGQAHVIQQEANLDYVLERMQHYVEGETDEGEKVLKKAAYLLYHLAYDMHIFGDGNKRTALTATLYFLNANGYAFPDSIASKEKQDEIAKLMKDTAEGNRSINALFRWLKSNAAKLPAI